MSRGEKRDTDSFSMRRSRDSKKNNNERHQRKHQTQRKDFDNKTDAALLSLERE